MSSDWCGAGRRYGRCSVQRMQEGIVIGGVQNREGARAGYEARLDKRMKKRTLVLAAAVVHCGRRRCCGDTQRYLVAGRRRRAGAAPECALAPSRSRSRPREEEGAGAHRCARHGHADGQRRGQDAASTARSSASISATARMVKQGDLLFTLDSRAIEAQIQPGRRPARSATRRSSKARARRARYTELVAKNAATPVTNLDNAKTQVDTSHAPRSRPMQAMLENLKVQLSYCTIRAPITGRISMAAVKVGNFVRSGRPRRRSPPSSRSRRSTSPSRCRSEPAGPAPGADATRPPTIEAIVPGDHAARRAARSP